MKVEPVVWDLVVLIVAYSSFILCGLLWAESHGRGWLIVAIPVYLFVPWAIRSIINRSREK